MFTEPVLAGLSNTMPETLKQKKLKKQEQESKHQVIFNQNNNETIYKQEVKQTESNSNKANEYYQIGISHYNKEQYQSAIDYFTTAIRLKPNHVNSYYYRGLSKSKLKQYESAINDYTQAILLNPNDSNSYKNRGIAKIALKQYNEAIIDLKEAIGLNNNDAIAYQYLGLAKCGLKRYESARYDYMYSIRLNPNNPTAYYLRGIYRYITYYNYNEKMSAFEDLQKAIYLFSTQNRSTSLKEAQKVDIILKSLKKGNSIDGIKINVTNEVMPIILKLDKKTTNELNSLSTEFKNENTSQTIKQTKQYNSSLHKNALNIDESVWISYLDSVQKQIKKVWKPKFDKSQSNSDKLTTSVLFEINSKGDIIKKQIIKKSSNQKYDKSVSNVISQINKFAPLPNSFNENITFVFDFTYVIKGSKEKDDIKIKDGTAQVYLSKEHYNIGKCIGKCIDGIITLPVTILFLIGNY